MGNRGRPLAMSATIQLEGHLQRLSFVQRGSRQKLARIDDSKAIADAVPNCNVRIGTRIQKGHGTEFIRHFRALAR
jgi:hypothetical protein